MEIPHYLASNFNAIMSFCVFNSDIFTQPPLAHEIFNYCLFSLFVNVFQIAMSLKLLLLVCLPFAMISVIVCEQSNHLENDPKFDARLSDVLAKSVLEFAQQLGTSILQDSKNPTEVFSPLSIYAVLTMVLLGANGKTYNEITNLLKLNDGEYILFGCYELNSTTFNILFILNEPLCFIYKIRFFFEFQIQCWHTAHGKYMNNLVSRWTICMESNQIRYIVESKTNGKSFEKPCNLPSFIDLTGIVTEMQVHHTKRFLLRMEFS